MGFRNLKIATKLNIVLGMAGAVLLIALLILFGHKREELFEERKYDARTLVAQALAVIEAAHAQAKSGAMSEDQAKAVAKAAIAQMRHGDGDYFWLQDASARVVMHPIKPELNGKDMSDFKDPGGQPIFVAFARLAQQKGGGDLNYLWPKPGHANPQPKIAPVEAF